MEELLTSLGVCLISIFLKIKLYSQKDLNIFGVFIQITEIYLADKAEWGWDDKSDQGDGCGAARDIILSSILSSPTLKQIRGLFQPGLHKDWNSIKRDFRLIKDPKHPVSTKVRIQTGAHETNPVLANQSLAGIRGIQPSI